MKHLLAIVIVAISYGCKKQATNDADIKTTIAYLAEKSISSQYAAASNLQNPYDYYGMLHNEGMNYVRMKMQAAGETSPEDVTKYVQEFSSGKTRERNDHDYYSLFQQLLKDSANFYAVLVEKASLSGPGRQYLKSIFQVITKRASQESFIYWDVKSEILEIETRILNDRSLPTYDYSELLKATSLARYSSYYWTQNPPVTKSIFGGILACVVGICADLSALEPMCGSFLDWMTGGDFDPIGVSAIMYYAL